MFQIYFQAPKPCKKWNGVLDATEFSKVCPQKDIITNGILGDEDCLYLNVQIPEDPKEVRKPKAVMVFVHGGGFMWGSGDSYSGEYLIEHDIILVTINYRLHVLGFLNLGLPECPGNVGLKDLICGLQWIKDNIKNFGGDPNNVTLFGESAGAACVYYLMLSPLAKGLFHKAIVQSGNPFSPWAFNEDPLKTAVKLGKHLGYSGCQNNMRDLLDFLLKIPINDLVNAQTLINKDEPASAFCSIVFSPSVEFHNRVEERLLPEHPNKLINKMTPVPLMTGVNDLEGLVFTRVFSNSKGTFLSALNENDEFFIPRFWHNLSSGLRNNIANRVKKFYFKDEKISDDTFEQFIDLLSDVGFLNRVYDIPRAILQKDPACPVFIYQFSYEGEMNLLKPLFMTTFPNCEIRKGPAHGDELFYLFKLNRTFDLFPVDCDNEKKMIGIICKFWTNFAKFGAPVLSACGSKWNPLTLRNPFYMKIDENPRLIRGVIAENGSKFWEALSKEVEMEISSDKSKL